MSVNPASIENAASHCVVVRGTGSIGMQHLAALRDRLGVRALAMPVRADRVNDLVGAGFTTVANAELSMSHAKSAVIVATNTGRHVADACALLRFGNVLVEKPLAARACGLAELERVALAAGRKVFVGFCMRFDPGLQRFRDLLPSIGPVQSVRICCQSYLPDWRPGRDFRACYSASAAEGGVLRDLSHEIDYALWLFGRPSRVTAVLTNRGRLGIDAHETADLLWETPAGCVVSIRLDYLSRVAKRGIEAIGAKGELVWDAVAGRVTRCLLGAEAEVYTAPVEPEERLALQAAAFLRGGDDGVLCTLDEGAFVVALTDAAQESSADGGAVTVADWRGL